MGTFLVGEIVGLTASPDPDYLVAGWSGTGNNASTLATNSLTMPASATAVSVTYQFPDHIVISNENLSGLDTREACLTITTGPATSVDSGLVIFRTSEKIVLNNGFSVASGANFKTKMKLPTRCSP